MALKCTLAQSIFACSTGVRFFQALAGIRLQLVPGNLSDKAFIDGIHIQAIDAEMQFVFRHPVGMIIASYLEGIAAGRSSLLVADPRLSLAVTGQNEEDLSSRQREQPY